ncbi:MAG: hypothetical protein KJ000_24325 [Pirellulaceae bacterium]|nr:hypothetical protein [Pirellulaceae bacterium]
MGLLSGLFGKKQRTLKDLTVDDLRREQLGLQQEQLRLDRELERLDKDELQLKSEYAEAASPTQKKSVARKIQDLRTRRMGAETRVSYLQKMLRSVNGFLLIKENMAFFDKMGVASALAQMDMSEIEAFINEATVEGTLKQDKLAALLQSVTDGVTTISASATDGSLDELMAELDGEVAQQTVSAGAETDRELSDVMSELDAAISRGERAARQAQKERSSVTAPPPKTPAVEAEREG